MALVANLINGDFGHSHTALVDLGAVHFMSFKFLPGVVAVKTPFTEVHPTFALGVLFTKKPRKILNPDLMVGDGSYLIIVICIFTHFFLNSM